MKKLRVGFFLAYRQLKRSSKWAQLLIVLIMTLTFLNLVAVNGILVGLVEGASKANKNQYAGDILLSTPEGKSYISRSSEIINFLRSIDGVVFVNGRYVSSGAIEANYQNIKNVNDERNIMSGQLVGIDPLKEDDLTNLSELVTEGDYLNNGEIGKILIGENFLEQYAETPDPGLDTLKNVEVGSKVKIIIDNEQRELEVKGFIGGKSQAVKNRIYFWEGELKPMIGRIDNNYAEINLKLYPGTDPNEVKHKILNNDLVRINAEVQTAIETQGAFLQDISTTFGTLGNVIGSIGLVIASITVFIIIFINAVNKKKYIGIMKAIGIDAKVIEISYVIQSLFYAILGSAIGTLLLYFFLEPFFLANPIDFPFSDGILAVDDLGVILRIGVLLFVTIFAGYIPAKLIVRETTINIIRGR